MTTIIGSAQPLPKFGKTPETRARIVEQALHILTIAAAAPGKGFQALAGVGGTDRAAYRAALPAKHKRGGKFSRAARRAWTLAHDLIASEQG